MTEPAIRADVLMPARRLRHLVVRDVDDSCLVYDETTDTVTLLDEITAGVWRRCDGSTTRELVAVDLQIDEAELTVALGRVAEAGLLKADGVSRRLLIARAASAGTLASLATMVAPAALAAASFTPASPIIGTVSVLRTSCTRGSTDALGSTLSFTVRMVNWAPRTAYTVKIYTVPPGSAPGTPTNVTTRAVTTSATRQANIPITVKVPRRTVQNPVPVKVEVYTASGNVRLLVVPAAGGAPLTLASC